MRCHEASFKLSQLMDEELTPFEEQRLRRHLERCASCRTHLQRLEAVREIISLPVSLPDTSSIRMKQRLRSRYERRWSDTPLEFWSGLRAMVRDLDRRAAALRVSAIPLSLGLLLLFVSQLPSLHFQAWTFPVYETKESNLATTGSRPPVLVQVMQSNQSVNELMDAAWKIPYEDSFSVVAEIMPEGNAEIGDVLEYPKTMELLDAVDLTLRESRINTTFEDAGLFLIYSFQKVDVYEGL